ncbi:helix-turn-helix transcriptional regulator [Microbacterium testaceum]|uniref:helix-turn-helix transcriptional regulator n=1 Tax=Microbacterium testaceum TaxID=2033 RepID=UPI002AC693F9|nr:LuxR C-terminal-related transcriptional regulator [Microbacterium testaceum]MDZ5146294.1 LuxR C-terminal-related transcriptional regulator [Microbacterium testaceum]
MLTESRRPETSQDDQPFRTLVEGAAWRIPSTPTSRAAMGHHRTQVSTGETVPSSTYDLQRAIGANNASAVAALLQVHFYRYLAEVPELLQHAFQTIPAVRYVAEPRLGILHVIALAEMRPDAIPDRATVDAYREWIDAKEAPLMHDVLELRQAELAEFVAHGCVRDAVPLIEQTLADMRTARLQEDLSDIAPSVLMRCGKAKLLIADLRSASDCFVDAIRWATRREEHPVAMLAREHLALVHALEERFADAESLLRVDSVAGSQPRTWPGRQGPAGMLAQILVNIASLDFLTADSSLAQIDDEISHGELGWVLLHARAQMPLSGIEKWDLIHRINTQLSTGSKRTATHTLAGVTLRADLVGLYQAVDDLRAAGNLLTSPGCASQSWALTLPLARQALLCGRPERALALLRRNERDRQDATPARHLPSGAVLYASAELAASGDVAISTLELAATAVTHHHGYAALTHASTALRQRLAPLIDVPDGPIPTPWAYRDKVKLTSREREVLVALHAHSTINQVAAALHVSPNTAKTHVRALYRKLGAHTRDEALWLGQP